MHTFTQRRCNAPQQKSTSTRLLELIRPENFQGTHIFQAYHWRCRSRRNSRRLNIRHRWIHCWKWSFGTVTFRIRIWCQNALFVNLRWVFNIWVQFCDECFHYLVTGLGLEIFVVGSASYCTIGHVWILITQKSGRLVPYFIMVISGFPRYTTLWKWFSCIRFCPHKRPLHEKDTFDIRYRTLSVKRAICSIASIMKFCLWFWLLPCDCM